MFQGEHQQDCDYESAKKHSYQVLVKEKRSGVSWVHFKETLLFEGKVHIPFSSGSQKLVFEKVQSLLNRRWTCI